MTGVIFLETDTLSVSETDGTVGIPIVRTGDLSGEVNILFGISPDTATEGEDYEGTSGSLVLEAGEDRVLITADILNDALPENTEEFVFSIISVDSGSLLFPRTARINILDDETPIVDEPTPPLESDFFIEEQGIVTGLQAPIALEFLPTDPTKLLVAEKRGIIEIVDTATGEVTGRLLDIQSQVNNSGDRGLLDIEFHPNFPEEPYLYAFYVVDPPETADETGNAGQNGNGNRFSYLSRFTLDEEDGFLSVVENSETVLLGNGGQSLSDISGNGAINSTSEQSIPDSEIDPDSETGEFKQDYLKVDSTSHAGGSIAFGPDGALYVSTGDGTSFNFADTRTVSVQDINSLSGKILRIDPMTGDGLEDNPFHEEGDSLSANSSKVYQLGLRNPFSIAFGQDGELIIADTGWRDYEEINIGGPGANFGWPFYEGGDNGVILETRDYRDITEAPAFYQAVADGDIEITPGFRGFSHSNSDPGFQVQAITGADSVISSDVYPTSLQNHYIFTDVAQGEVFAVNLNDRTDVKFLFETAGRPPVYIKQGPDGFLYFTDIVNGRVGRLEITDPDAPLPPPSSEFAIGVNARGARGDEAFDLLIDGEIVASFTNIGDTTRSFFYDPGETIEASQVRVAFNNDLFLPEQGIDRDLIVDSIVIGDQTFETEAQTTFADGVFVGGEGITSGFGLGDTLHTNGFFQYDDAGAPPPEAGIQINAFGAEGDEAFDVLIDGAVVASFNNIGTAPQTFSFDPGVPVEPAQVQIAFTNDLFDPSQNIDRNLTVDSIAIDGQLFQTEDPNTFASGVFVEGQGITSGFGLGETLHANGFFQFDGEVEPPAGTAIGITARGNEGDEAFDLLIDGAVVASFENIGTGQQTFTFDPGVAVTASQIRIAFTNDLFDPDQNIDRNLTVDSIAVGGQIFQTEDTSVFADGVFVQGEGITSGFGLGETLHTNGFFQFDDPDDAQQAGRQTVLDTDLSG